MHLEKRPNDLSHENSLLQLSLVSSAGRESCNFISGMKKVIVSILAVLYLCSSVGATVHLHYCMGKLVNWSLTDKDGDKCDKCGMQKDGGCCKDEQQFVKNSLDQKTTESAIQFMHLIANAAPGTVINISDLYSSSLAENYSISHAPPLKSGVDILIRNCIFRI